MILAKEQIERYLRHVIMPEISGKGQKKLLESTIYLYGENTDEIMPMVLYLSAIGIGKIYCCLKDDAGYESLFCKAVDLNNDVSIDIANNNIPLENADVRILFGS